MMNRGQPAAAESTRLSSILIVDDERDIRDGAERILTRMGHRVVKAENGEEALDVLREWPAEIILLDLKMPGMDGMEILDRIRESLPDALVIIVTGFATIETAIEAMKKGAYDFMTKPFRPDQLRITIGRAIEHIVLKEERDRLSAERELGLWTITKEKSRLRTVVDSIVAGLMITEVDKRIIMCNPAFYNLTRLESDRVIGSSVTDHPSIKTVNDMLDELLAGRTDHRGAITREFEVGEERPTYIRATVSAVATETGKILGLVAVLRDVTHFKEQEKERSAYVAMLTHELRAPLSAVDTQFHVVLKGLTGDLSEKQRDMLGRMRARIRSVIEMINSLLDLSKIEARQFVQEKKPMSLGLLIEDAMDLMRTQAIEQGVALTAELEGDLPDVIGDPASLKEVLTNLISNAIRYSPDGGRVVVGACFRNGSVRLTVADNGIGIPKEYQEKIFDRFFRVKNDKTKHIIGTGLGLPIVKAIVDDHQGGIYVESEPGRGSVFTVTLPTADRSPADRGEGEIGERR